MRKGIFPGESLGLIRPPVTEVQLSRTEHLEDHCLCSKRGEPPSTQHSHRSSSWPPGTLPGCSLQSGRDVGEAVGGVGS